MSSSRLVVRRCPVRSAHPTAVWRIVLGLLLCASPVAAQGPPRTAAELTAGVMSFPDDGQLVTEGLVGAQLRRYLLPRVAVGPEFVYVSGDGHSHLILTGNVTWDLIGPSGDRPPKVTPFFVAGGGVYHTRHDPLVGPAFSSSEGAFTAGGGVRAGSGSTTGGVEVRIGWELHLRVNGFIGVRF